MASRPQLSFSIIVMGVIFTVLSGFVGAAIDEPNGVLTGVGRVAIAFTGLALGKLYLLDWPRHLVRTRLPLPSTWLLLGWLPASIAIVLLAMIPAWNFVAWILGALAVCAAQWAWIVGWTGVQGSLQNVLSIPFFRVLAYNFLATLWWLAAVEKMAPVPQLHVPVLCALIGSALGLPMAAAVWENRLTPRQRWSWLLATGVVAIAAAAVLWWLSDREAWQPVAAVLVIVAVLMQRHVAPLLDRQQQELRFGWMVAFFIGLIVMTVREGPLPVERMNSGFNLAITGFGLLLVSTVLLCALMAMWNEWRGRVAPYRDDPIHSALYW